MKLGALGQVLGSHPGPTRMPARLPGCCKPHDLGQASASQALALAICELCLPYGSPWGWEEQAIAQHF